MPNETPTGCSRPASDVARNVPLGQEAAGLLKPDQTSGEFLAVLINCGLRLDAIRFAAHALRKHEAVWWGALCLWEFYRPDPAAGVSQVLQATVRWLQEPDDQNRRAVDAAGKNAGGNTPAGSLATAVFFSGGSVSLPELPEVQPKPHMTAQNVANAVVLACKQTGVARQAEFQSHCLLLALDVARGELPWQQAELMATGATTAATP